jgi:hypothetical protein
MTALPRLADSVEPNLIPRRFAQQPNGVMGWFNGDYAWPSAEYARWPRWTRISARPLRLDPAAAAVRELDVERGDAQPGDVPAFYEARKRPYKDAQVIAYCDRSTVPAVRSAMLSLLGAADLAKLLWHIAAPASDAPAGGWNPASLTAEIRAAYGVTLDPAQVWAIQDTFAGTYDVSTVYGQPRWV